MHELVYLLARLQFLYLRFSLQYLTGGVEHIKQ